MVLFGWFRGSGRPSGFCSSSTAEQVTDGVDASHLTAIVTGASSGIGKETARVLALRGATVVIPARTLEAAAKARESLLEGNPDAKIEAMVLDLGSLASVESFACAFLSSGRPLHILINNAGICWAQYQLSTDGVELQFATNHLGHFFLTKLLLDKMKATAGETGTQGRIINISSSDHAMADGSWLDLDTINDQSKYRGLHAYGRSKLSNILHVNELSRRLQEEGANVTANSVHPGVILTTNILRHIKLPGFVFSSLAVFVRLFFKSVPQGAATTCYLALNPGAKDVTGKYFADCNEVTPTHHARDGELAKKLWDLSEELVDRSQVQKADVIMDFKQLA